MSKTPHFVAVATFCAGTVFASGVSAREFTSMAPQQTITFDRSSSERTPPVVTCVAWSFAGRHLATAGDDHQVRLWTPDTDRRSAEGAASVRRLVLVDELGNHADWVRAVAFRPDGARLATAGDDQRVRLWDVPGGRTPVVLPGTTVGIRALSFSPNGRQLAVAGFEDHVQLFDSESGRMERELPAPGGDIRSVAFAPDGTQLAAAGRAGTVRVWRVSDGAVLHDLPAGSRRIRAVEFSEDGSLLAAGGDDGVIRLWNPATGTIEAELPARPGRAMALCFCGPGRLAVGRSTNTIELWDLASQRPVAKLAGHTGSVATLAYEPTSGTLVSGGFDCTVRLWNVQP